MTSFSSLIHALADAKVNFVIIGGVALVSRGGARVTHDLDVSYERTAENFERLVKAIAPLHPPTSWSARRSSVLV